MVTYIDHMESQRIRLSNGVSGVLLGTLGSFGGLIGPRVAQRNSNGSKDIQVRHKEFQGGQIGLREYPKVLDGSRKSNGSYGLPSGSMGVLMDSRGSKKDL